MVLKTNSRNAMPLAYYNPDTKCWLNALMVLLTVFRPFQDTLASTEKSGQVVDMLKEHFKNPPLRRNQGKASVIDTSKVARNMRVSIEQHLEFCTAQSCQARQLLDMLSTTNYQDPGDFWNLLHSVVREELGIDAETSHIGIRANETLFCNECQTCRTSNLNDNQYMYHALELRDMTKGSRPSVQAAIQSFFSPESGVEVRCCQDERNTDHDKFYECQNGGSGVVFYCPFTEDSLHRHARAGFKIDEEIRLPYLGPSSGLQSSYELIGFTARYVHKAHHFAVIYDQKQQPWTFDDDTITKGLPADSWVPMLVGYELWHPQVATVDIHFPALLDIANAVRDGQEPTSQDADDSEASFVASPQGCTTRHGRNSQPTNRYKPEDPRKSHKGNANKLANAINQSNNNMSQSQQNSSSEDENSSHATPSRTRIGVSQRATDATPQRKQPAQLRNELSTKYPAGSWVWAKRRGNSPFSSSPADYLIAKIIGPASGACMHVEWACESGTDKISNKAILRAPSLAEERLIFPLPQDQGRLLTLVQVTALLNSQGTSRHLSSLQCTQEKLSPEDGYSGLITTSATTNWKSLAFPWLLDDDTSFSPAALIGMPFSLPSKVPSECFRANHEFKKYPSFGNCIREITLAMQQLNEGDRLHQQLFAWLHLMPIILLRAPNSCGRKALAALIEKRCTLLLDGQWELLFKNAGKDADKICLCRTRMNQQQPVRNTIQLKQATRCIRAGNLSKGARLLTGGGTSADPQAYMELQEKHPQDVPPAFFAPDYVPPAISSQQADEFDHLLSTANLARVAGTFPAESHPDQWGWRAREYISPLLHDPELGELIRACFILPRCNGKLPQLHGECYRGGCLIALSKAPKPGLRPINIGDAFRRLADKAVQPFSKKDLAHTFEHAYTNVKQFASGITDGAEKFIVTTLLALQEHPAAESSSASVLSSHVLDSDPVVILKLDAKNAFNSIQRQFILDMIQGKVDVPYARGRLNSQNITALPATFAAHIPSIKGHYEGDGRLIFVDTKGEARQITSRTGVHQGCVLGGKLFNIGTFSIVGATMADHPEVYCPMFSDNMSLVGRLSKALAAADDLRESLLEIGLSLQPADSAIYIPSYVQQERPPALLDALRDQYPALRDVPWHRDGIILLGCPIGTDEFVNRTLDNVCDNIEQRAAQFANVDDGLIHLQLHKFSVNSMLPYFLRTASPQLTVSHARRIDALIWKGLLDFSHVSEDNLDQPALHSMFADAQCQVTLPISEGGFGITPNECVAITAFYSGFSRALRFASSVEFTPIRDYLVSPSFLSHPLYVAYTKARQDLIDWGAQEPEQAQSPSDETPSRASAQQQQQQKPKHKPPVLPTVADVLVHSSSQQVVFPEQKVLTRLAQKAHQRWSTEGLTEEGKKRAQHLSRQTITACSTADETGKYLQGIARFPEELQLRHSPLAFLSHTASLSEKFPQDVFSVLFCFLLGLRAPPCLQNTNISTCEGCSLPMDPYGHHRMTCAKTSSYHVAHAQLAAAFADIARRSGVPYMDKNVPRHLTTDKVGDALIDLSDDSRQLVLDYTITHPILGTRSGAGTLKWNDKALANKVKDKWNKHGNNYAVIGYAFAPCAMTTYGQIHGHLLRLLYILAKKQAEAVHVHQRPSTPVEYLFGLFFAQSRARLGAAVARGMALRAMGCSLMGASKVFLRHIAPARYRDQTLSAGEHLAAGFSQWRLALAV